MLGQFALLVLALLAVTQEYASGAIGPTLQWTPRRGVLLAARVPCRSWWRRWPGCCSP